MNATTQLRVALAAVAATLLTALSIGPLIRGVGWFIAVFVVVAIVSGVGMAARQVTRSTAVVIGAQVLALFLSITALFVRDSGFAGVPGPGTIGALLQLTQDGLSVTQQQAPPVAATQGVILLATGGLALVALAVDVIAVSLRRPAVAGLPLLLVYCVPAAVLNDALGLGYFFLAGIGYLVLVAADSDERVRGWGRVLGSAGRPTLGAGGPLPGARRIAAGSLAAAILIPALVPGVGERLVPGDGGDGTGEGGGNKVAVVNPILRLREDLNARSDTVVITYQTTMERPEPLRIVTVDQFSGDVWQPSSASLPRGQLASNGLPAAPGLSPNVSAQPKTTKIEIGDLAQTYLPLPYPTTKVEGLSGSWLWDARTLNVVGADATTQNLRYTVQHQDVQPTAEQLRSAGPAPANVLEQYTALPADRPSEIATTARQVAGNGSTYDKMLNLQQWLRSDGRFQYSERVDANERDDSGQDAVLAFLRNKRGYCVQFASAMAVMARTLGVPARVAVGFLPGTFRDGRWEISLRDAHAWPEIYFEGVGWTRFEPTPSLRSGQSPRWAQPEVDETPREAVTPSAEASPNATRPAPDAAERAGTETGESTQAPAWQRVWNAIPWRILGVVVLVLALSMSPLAGSRLARRLRWRRAATRRARAEAAWDELREQLADLEVGSEPSWTPRGLQERLVHDHTLDGTGRVALARLTDEVEQARYAPPGGDGPSPESLRADIRSVTGEVASGLPPAQRRKAAWLPASGLAVLGGLVRRVDVATQAVGERRRTSKPASRSLDKDS